MTPGKPRVWAKGASKMLEASCLLFCSFSLSFRSLLEALPIFALPLFWPRRLLCWARGLSRRVLFLAFSLSSFSSFSSDQISFQYKMDGARKTSFYSPSYEQWIGRDDYVCAAIETALSPDGVWNTEGGELVLWVGDYCKAVRLAPFLRPLLLESFLAFCMASKKVSATRLPEGIRRQIWEYATGLLQEKSIFTWIMQNWTPFRGSALSPTSSKKKPRVSAPKYFVNHTLQIFVDLKKMPSEAGQPRDLKYHPMPILTCASDSGGGGDYKDGPQAGA